MKKIFNKIKILIVIGVLLVIPFFYVFFFLKAFWDPYSNMKNVPVAVANLDEGNLGKEIVEELKKSNIMNLKEVKEDIIADEGVKNRKYYASITIPNDFTENLNHLKQTKITFRSNKKNSFIASQIYERAAKEIQNQIKIKLASKIITTLHSGILDTNDKINLLNEGLSELENGSLKLSSGINTLNDKYIDFFNGMNSLNNGITTLYNGSNEYISGVNKASEGLDKISNGVVLLGDKAGILKLSSNFRKLYAGAKKIQDEKVKEKLENGGNKILSGISELKLGSNKLYKGTNDVKEALNKIQEGSEKLSNGLSKAHKALDSSTKEAKEKIKQINNINDFIDNSVELNIINIDDVSNYGVVFVAYFMSISLWVGSLVILVSMYYDSKKRFGIFDQYYENKYKQFFSYIGLILLQSLIVSILISKSFDFVNLKFSILLLSVILIDLCFFSIVYWVISLFGDIGKFFAIILLIVQISASAGTFPIETAPKIFMDIFPFIPMKYSVNLLKEVFGGINIVFYKYNFLFLLYLLIAFVFINLVSIFIKNFISKKYFNIK